MVFKINISDLGKTFKVELESEDLIGKKIGDIIDGTLVSGELKGYELKITGTSDKSGFAGKADEQGPQLKKVLFTKGKFLRKVPNKGVRKKKSVRGNEISNATIQINTSVSKKGGKTLEEVFSKKDETQDSGEQSPEEKQ